MPDKLVHPLNHVTATATDLGLGHGYGSWGPEATTKVIAMAAG